MAMVLLTLSRPTTQRKSRALAASGAAADDEEEDDGRAADADMVMRVRVLLQRVLPKRAGPSADLARAAAMWMRLISCRMFCFSASIHAQ